MVYSLLQSAIFPESLGLPLATKKDSTQRSRHADAQEPSIAGDGESVVDDLSHTLTSGWCGT